MTSKQFHLRAKQNTKAWLPFVFPMKLHSLRPSVEFALCIILIRCRFLNEFQLIKFVSFSDMRRDVQEVFRMTPHEKQVMMFSATLPKDIRPVCKKFMQDVNIPIVVTIAV